MISTGALDRYNSTIAVEGWKTENFEKNPVVLWAHDDSIPAIGRAANVRVEGGRLKSRATFAERDVHPLADTVYQLIKAASSAPLRLAGFRSNTSSSRAATAASASISSNRNCSNGRWSIFRPIRTAWSAPGRSGSTPSPLIAWAERALDQGGMTLIPRAEIEALRKAAGAPAVYEVPPFLPSRSADGRQHPRLLRMAANVAVNTSPSSKAQPRSTRCSPTACCRADEFAARLTALARDFATKEKRAGRVLSAENERRLRAAHDHCMAAGDHVMSVIEQNHKPDEPRWRR